MKGFLLFISRRSTSGLFILKIILKCINPFYTNFMSSKGDWIKKCPRAEEKIINDNSCYQMLVRLPSLSGLIQSSCQRLGRLKSRDWWGRKKKKIRSSICNPAFYCPNHYSCGRKRDRGYYTPTPTPFESKTRGLNNPKRPQTPSWRGGGG